MCKNGEKCIVGQYDYDDGHMDYLDTSSDIQFIIDRDKLWKDSVDLFCYCPRCGMAINHMKYKYYDVDDNVSIGNMIQGKYE